MRTASLHFAFALATVGLVAIAGTLSYRLQRAESFNRAISADVAGTMKADVPEIALSRALAMANKGEYENALKGYKALVDDKNTQIRQTALYNLGNLHLREALRKSGGAAAQSLPLVELAKQSYRDVLRRDPSDWDARYNVEITLRLSPEVEGESREDEGPPMAKERAVTTMRGGKMDLP